MSIDTYQVFVPDREAPYPFSGMTPEEINEVLLNENVVTEANTFTVVDGVIRYARPVGGDKG